MEASREPVHGREGRHHQPLELAASTHLRPGVPHPAADGHLPPDTHRQGELGGRGGAEEEVVSDGWGRERWV